MATEPVSPLAGLTGAEGVFSMTDMPASRQSYTFPPPVNFDFSFPNPGFGFPIPDTNLNLDKSPVSAAEPTHCPQSNGVAEGPAQDEAIQALLKDGMEQQDILKSVQAYKGATQGGFLEKLEIIAAISPEALPTRIQAAATIGQTSSGTPDTIARPLAKRPAPDGVDDRPDDTYKRARTERFAEMGPLPGRVTSKKRRPCPGDTWKCVDRPKDGRKGWPSFKPFETHFKAEHLASLREGTGAFAACPFCPHLQSFNGDGSVLIKHLWDVHMDPTLSGSSPAFIDQSSPSSTGGSTPAAYSPLA